MSTEASLTLDFMTKTEGCKILEIWLNFVRCAFKFLMKFYLFDTPCMGFAYDIAPRLNATLHAALFAPLPEIGGCIHCAAFVSWLSMVKIWRKAVVPNGSCSSCPHIWHCAPLTCIASSYDCGLIFFTLLSNPPPCPKKINFKIKVLWSYEQLLFTFIPTI